MVLQKVIKTIAIISLFFTFLSCQSFSATKLKIIDQEGKPVVGADVAVVYRCPTFNPVDSAGSELVLEVKGLSNQDGLIEAPSKRHFHLMGQCSKSVAAFKKNYAPLNIGHGSTGDLFGENNYTSIGHCVKEIKEREFKENHWMHKNAISIVHPLTYSTCTAGGGYQKDVEEIVVKLYEVRTCENLKKLFKFSDDRMELARNLETLIVCASNLNKTELEKFLPLLSNVLAVPLTTYSQPTFHEDSIISSAIKVLGYFCSPSEERIGLLKPWLAWIMKASSNTGWTPYAWGEEIATSLYLMGGDDAQRLLEEYLEYRTKQYHNDFPNIAQIEKENRPSFHNPVNNLKDRMKSRKYEVCAIR